MRYWGGKRSTDDVNVNASSGIPSHILPITTQRPTDPVRLLPLRAPLNMAFRTGVVGCALLLTALQSWHELLHFANFVAVLLASALLLLVRCVPISGTRERPLTFTAPIVFAILLWIGPGAAATGALLVHLLLARFVAARGSSRSSMRLQGAQLAIAALAAQAVLTALPSRYSAGAASGIPANGPALPLLTGAMLAALAFVGVSLLLEIGGQLGHTGAGKPPATYRQFGQTLLLYGIGLLPLVLLAPLGASRGLAVGLPALLLLLLSAQTARLITEINSLRGQLKTAEAMGRASVGDTETTKPELLLQRFLSLAQDLVSAERAVVWIMDHDTGELTPQVALPDAGPFARKTARYGEGLIGHAAVRIRPRLVPDAARDPHRGRREAASGAWLLYPIVVRGEVLGVAQWIRPVHRPFSLDDITRLDSLVPQATIALENVTIRAQMHHLAATDGLTGLWNQRRMMELLRDEMRRATRYQRPLSVLMLDVDSFKTFNDTYGHPQGDHLLRSIAATLNANVRNVDYVGRYGGEEFIIVLPETAKHDACTMAERVRKAVEERGCVIFDGTSVYRTISVGVASYPEDALNPAELIERADEALYRAKRAGKNCVIWA